MNNYTHEWVPCDKTGLFKPVVATHKFPLTARLSRYALDHGYFADTAKITGTIRMNKGSIRIGEGSVFAGEVSPIVEHLEIWGQCNIDAAYLDGDTVTILNGTTVGRGSTLDSVYLGSMVTVGCNSQLRKVHIKSASFIGSDCTILSDVGQYCVIGNEVLLGAYSILAEFSQVASGVDIGTDTDLGAYCIISADVGPGSSIKRGSTVTYDLGFSSSIPENTSLAYDLGSDEEYRRALCFKADEPYLSGGCSCLPLNNNIEARWAKRHDRVMALGQQERSYPVAEYEDGQWWVKELESLFVAPIGSGVTADQKRAANIALNFMRTVWVQQENDDYGSAKRLAESIYRKHYLEDAPLCVAQGTKVRSA